MDSNVNRRPDCDAASIDPNSDQSPLVLPLLSKTPPQASSTGTIASAAAAAASGAPGPADVDKNKPSSLLSPPPPPPPPPSLVEPYENQDPTTPGTTVANGGASSAGTTSASASSSTLTTTTRLHKTNGESNADQSNNNDNDNNNSNNSNNESAGGQSFFWVHSNPQSIAGGSKNVTLKRIRSHVMAEHNRKKRQENIRRHQNKNRKNLASQSMETAGGNKENRHNSNNRNNDSNKSDKNKNFVKRPSSQKPQPYGGRTLDALDFSYATSSSFPPYSEKQRGSVAGDVELAQGELVGDGVITATTASSVATNDGFGFRRPSPWTYVPHGSYDPFDALHTQLSDRMLRHLRYFLHDLTRMACPLLTRGAATLQTHWISLVQRGPAPLHACICVATSNAALLSGDLLEADPSKRWSSPLVLDTYHHRGETIRLVNEGLSDPVRAASDELIAAVSTLLTIEITSGNTDYLKIHLAGLRQMVAIRNSFENLPPMLRNQISWNDIRIACMALTKPIFPFVRFPRPSATPTLLPGSDLSFLATRFMPLTEVPGLLGTTLSQLISDLLELTLYAESAKGDNSVYQIFDEKVDEYFNNEVLYVEYSLNADRYTATGEAKRDSTIEGCIRLACLLFHNTAIWQFYPVIAAVFSKPILALRNAVETTMATGCYNLCIDLLIWILFIGASASSPALASEREFFVTQLSAVIRSQHIQTWQELRALLMGFFYVDRSYLVPLRGLWDEIRTIPVRV